MRAGERWLFALIFASILAGAGLLSASAWRLSQPSALETVQRTPIEVLPITAPARNEPTLPLQPAVYTVPEPEPDCGIPVAAIELIIAFEVGSPEVYEKKYKHLIYPGGQSGATGGYGTDFGYRKPHVIARDWHKHPHVVRLQTASGITGPLARDVVRRLADITIESDLALEVFEQTEVVEHLRLARRAFREDFFCAAPANVRGALASLVFNRGASMAGANRSEMRHIRDACLPARDWGCVAHQLRTMRRIWKGTDLYNGLARRREAEAQLAERAT